MKFNLPTPQPLTAISDELRIGNVYACQGGGKTRYWIVIGLDDRMVNLVGVNAEGTVTSTGNYGRWVFERVEPSRFFRKRLLLGRCEGLEALEFDVVWYGDGEP